jgi:cell division protein FtsB
MANTRHGRFFRIVFSIFMIMVISFMAKSIYIKHIKIQELSKESSSLDEQITKVSDEIVNIKRDIEISKNDPYAIEHKAKDRFLMVHKDETILMFKDN